MIEWHGYFGIENINLSNAQRSELITSLRALGNAPNSKQPAKLLQERLRLDNDAAIYEAQFDDNNLTIAAFKQRLATIFSVDIGTISHANNPQTFDTIESPVIIFTHSGTDYLRLALFAGVGASWNESRKECVAYLIANSEAWESDE